MVETLFPITADAITVRRRGKTLLGPLSLTLEAARFTVVIGPNGAGKTTLLKTLSGMERLNTGTLTRAVTPDRAEARQAYVFQTPVMLRRSVGDNLAYPLHLIGAPKAEITSQVQHWATRIGLGDALHRPALRLSGGEKQKLSLARALIRRPDLLFLDEPCTNLDGYATREIEAMLQEARAQGTGIIMATHDLGQARRLADDLIFLLRGHIHERGDASLFAAPRTPELSAFFAGDIVA